jgi:hypothetical protein
VRFTTGSLGAATVAVVDSTDGQPPRIETRWARLKLTMSADEAVELAPALVDVISQLRAGHEAATHD